MHKIKYIIFIILLLLFVLLFKRYYNSPFHFWSCQPVFHIYNLTYYFYSDKVIRENLPKPNVYTKCKLMSITDDMPFINYEVDVNIIDVDANVDVNEDVNVVVKKPLKMKRPKATIKASKTKNTSKK